MNMEVKLLREKQAQSEGNSLWGVINRSSQPLVANILDSNQKYQTMRRQVDQDLNVPPFLCSIINMITSDWPINKAQSSLNWPSSKNASMGSLPLVQSRPSQQLENNKN